MEIIKKSKELTAVELYLMTKAKNIQSAKDLEDGAKIAPVAHILYEDTNSKGEKSEMLAIMGTNNEVWACQSKTFKEDFEDIASLFVDEPYTIIKQSGTSKAGREFVYCILEV